MRAEFGNLRESTVSEIFTASLSNCRITRANIADTTGLSVMTVGKAIDAFVSLRVLRQSISQDSVSGRRSRILSVSQDRWFGIFDITSSVYSIRLCDLSLNVIDSFTYRYNSNYFIDENLSFFLEKADVFINRSVDSSLCCGIGVLLPGEYDSISDRIVSADGQPLGSVKINQLFSKHLYGCKPLIGDIRTYSAYSVRRTLVPEKTALYVFTNSSETISCYLNNADKSENIRFCHMGVIPVSVIDNLSNVIASEGNPDESAKLLARVLFTVFASVPVDKIFISGNRYKDMDAFSMLVSDYNNEICIRRGILPPEIGSANCTSTGVSGICAALRKSWFNKFILEI